MSSSISIVIPVFNEDYEINKLLSYLSTLNLTSLVKEIIVVDCNQSSKIRVSGAEVLQSPNCGRSNQLSYGAEHVTGDILYFLHADSLPPRYFAKTIQNAVSSGAQCGCFRLKFDSDRLFFRFFAWFTRFNVIFCRGGDQSLFVTKNLYNKVGGYDEALNIMEDIEIVKRLKKVAKFHVLKDKIETSTRKYDLNGKWGLQFRFSVLHIKHLLGFSPQHIYKYYKKHIK